MPDLGDLLDFDFSGGSGDIDLGGGDWTAALNLGDFGTADLVLDTVTGEMVDASSVDPNEIANVQAPNVSGGPTGTSLSDQLRSRAVDPTTPGSERFDWNAMADPSASIASAGGGVSDWLKALDAGPRCAGREPRQRAQRPGRHRRGGRGQPHHRPPRSAGRRWRRRVQPRGERALSRRAQSGEPRDTFSVGQPEAARYASVGQPMDAGGGGAWRG